MPNKHINNADDMYNIIRKDNAYTQMVTYIQELHLKCCYISEGIHTFVGIVKEIKEDKFRKEKMTWVERKTIFT